VLPADLRVPTRRSPLGMDDTGQVDQSAILPESASGYALNDDRLVHPDFLDFSQARGAAGVYSTVHDLFLWDEALYTEKALSAAALEQMFTPQKLTDGSETRYGLGWSVGTQNGLREIAHGGQLNGFTAHFARFPDQHFLVVVLCNNPRLYPGDLAASIAEIYLFDDMDWDAARMAEAP
jgi:CubicO group peptidase (beta-lactamase class C family)